MADNLSHPRRVITIDDLPDDDLLEIFDLYVVRYQDLIFFNAIFRHQDTKRKIESWQSLVHVCRRWRYLVFGSPCRLDLQLYYGPKISARKPLDVWPALPLLIQGNVHETSVDDAIAGLEHRDRIRQINLHCRTDFHFIDFWVPKLLSAMDVPFPELTDLHLSSKYWLRETAIAIHDSFLGGSAPRLQCLSLHCISFPGLPKLLLSATHLVKLYLRDTPYSAYISPEVMVTCVSISTSLKTIVFEFEPRQSHPDVESRRSFPPSRSVLPTLMNFSFKGMSEYLEEFVARIDAPQLSRLSTEFVDDKDFDFDTSELKQFVNRTPTLETHD